MVTQGTLVSSYFKIRPTLLTRSFLMFSPYMLTRKSSPTLPSWQSCFSTNRNNLKNLGRVSPKQHLSQIMLKSVYFFWKRRFFKSSLYTYKKNRIRTLVAIFLTDQNILNGHRKSICAKLFSKQASTSPSIHIRKTLTCQ